MIVILTNYYYPEFGAASNRITELTKQLSKKGLKITVLAPIPTYPYNMSAGKYHKRFTEEIINKNLRVIRIKIPVKSIKNLRTRVISEMILVLYALIYFCLNLRKETKKVVTTSPPFFINFFGLFCKVVLRKVWIQEIRDLWPDSIVGTGVAQENSLVINFLKFLERRFYKSASKIVAVTAAMAEHIKLKLPSTECSKVLIIPNTCSEEMKKFAEKYKKINAKQKLDDDKKITIGYVGNLGRAQDLELLVNIIKKVKDENKNKQNKEIEFLIVGEGAKKDWLKQQLADTGVILKDGTNNKEEIAKYYSIIDIFIIPLKDHPVFETVIPSKVYELIAFEKPFIHFTKGELARIGELSNLGILVARNHINYDLCLSDIKKRKKVLNKNRILSNLSETYENVLLRGEEFGE